MCSTELSVFPIEIICFHCAKEHTKSSSPLQPRVLAISKDTFLLIIFKPWQIATSLCCSLINYTFLLLLFQNLFIYFFSCAQHVRTHGYTHKLNICIMADFLHKNWLKHQYVYPFSSIYLLMYFKIIIFFIYFFFSASLSVCL